MPTDYFLEDLPDGGDILPTDTMYLQRRVSGVWEDFQFKAGNVNGTEVFVHTGTYTEADIVGPQDIILFTPPVGKAVIFLPMAYIRFETASPTGLSEAFQIGSPADQLNINFTNSNTVETLALTQAVYTILITGDAVLELSAGLASLSFTLYIRAPYVLVDI